MFWTPSTKAAGAWRHFLIVEIEDHNRPLTKLSPFATQKWFEGVSSKITNIKRLKEVAFLVECPSKHTSDMLLARSGGNFVDRKVKVSPHRSLNCTKGVIRCRELEGISDDEIQAELASQGVEMVRRVTVKKGEGRVPTNTFFVTFATPTLPDRIKIGYVSVTVSLFVPAPMRCFQCQKFGHSKLRCTGQANCERCGHKAHDGACSEAPVCSNCKGDHSPRSKDCPKFQFESAVQRVRTERKLSFPEAKKEVEKSQAFSFTKSFASVAKPGQIIPKRNAGTQAGQGVPENVLREARTIRRVVQVTEPPTKVMATQASGPAPLQAARLAPSQAAKPATQQAAKPAPRQAAKPAPRQAAKPVLTQAPKPAPKEATKPPSKAAAQPPSKGAVGPKPAEASKPPVKLASPPRSPRASAPKVPGSPRRQTGKALVVSCGKEGARSSKMEQDEIKMYNRFSALESDDIEEDMDATISQNGPSLGSRE